MGWQNFVAALIQAGNTTIINSQGTFVYNGLPALNNLVVSSAPIAGVDSSGNAFLPGETVYRNLGGTWIAINMNPTTGGALAFYSATTEAGPWTAQGFVNGNNAGQIWLAAQDGSILQLSNGGNLVLSPISGQSKFTVMNGTGMATFQATPSGIPQIASGNDLNNYVPGHLLLINGGSVLINSTTPITIHSESSIAPGNYFVRGRVRFTSATGTIQPMLIRFAGNAVFTCSISVHIYQEGANVTENVGYISTQNADPSVGPNLGNSLNYVWEYEGYINVTTAGGFLVTGRQGLSSADETFTVLPASWTELKPT